MTPSRTARPLAASARHARSPPSSAGLSTTATQPRRAMRSFGSSRRSRTVGSSSRPSSAAQGIAALAEPQEVRGGHGLLDEVHVVGREGLQVRARLVQRPGAVGVEPKGPLVAELPTEPRHGRALGLERASADLHLQGPVPLFEQRMRRREQGGVARGAGVPADRHRACLAEQRPRGHGPSTREQVEQGGLQGEARRAAAGPEVDVFERFGQRTGGERGERSGDRRAGRVEVVG